MPTSPFPMQMRRYATGILRHKTPYSANYLCFLFGANAKAMQNTSFDKRRNEFKECVGFEIKITNFQRQNQANEFLIKVSQSKPIPIAWHKRIYIYMRLGVFIIIAVHFWFGLVYRNGKFYACWRNKSKRETEPNRTAPNQTKLKSDYVNYSSFECKKFRMRGDAIHFTSTGKG